MINTDLTGKRALVCGGSRGIGHACAVELAEHNATVIVLARNEEKLRDVAAELPTPCDQEHDYIACDLGDTLGLKEEIRLLLEEGPVEILINNSGGPKPGPVARVKPDEFEEAMLTHLYASTLLVRKLLPGMRGRHYGRIINIISTSVKSPIETLGVSNTVRGAVAAWVKSLSYEVAREGVTVNGVLPGFIKTQRLQQFISYQANEQGLAYEQMYAQLMDSVPAKRMGKPHEIAQVVAFLASPAASYVNGVALPVDGGRTHVL